MKYLIKAFAAVLLFVFVFLCRGFIAGFYFLFIVSHIVYLYTNLRDAIPHSALRIPH